MITQHIYLDWLNPSSPILATLVMPMQRVNHTDWISNPEESLQGSLMCYDGPKEFKNHKHKINPRLQEKTQECFIVIKGKVKVTIYHPDTKHLLGILEAKPNEAIFVYGGYHKVEFLEAGTIAYEIKAGCWEGDINKDKEFYD